MASAAEVDLARGEPVPALFESDETLATGELSLRRCWTCGEEFPSDYVVCPRDSTPLGLERCAEDPMLGIVLAGTYRVVRSLGHGGMGRLYEAQHTRLDRRFAIKVLHEAQARNRDACRRFEREARVLSRIRSDHVLSVVDVLRTPDDRSALVTSRLEGEDLKARLDRVGQLTVEEAVPIARQICRGLAAAHAEGVIHRDLKPSNLFLEAGADGRVTVKILDFGVAKLAGEPDLTRTGAVVGTPAYMAPEQARGSARVDERADVYAVGAVLYRMLTGKPPFSGAEPAQLLASLLHEMPKRPRTHEPSIPIGLEALIQAAMARNPDDRPPDALSLERELATFDPSGEPGAAAWEPRHGEEVSTLILPRGSVDRARNLAQRARRTRPAAAVLALTTATVLAGLTALLVVGVQTVETTSRTAVERSAAWLLVGAAGIGSMIMLVRWLARCWASAPEVQRVERTLGWSLLAAGAVSSGLELAVRATEVLEGESPHLFGWALAVRAVIPLFAGVLAGWVAYRR